MSLSVNYTASYRQHLSNLLLHNSLHFQHLIKTKGSEFQDTYSKEEASSVLFILTANEQIQAGSWLQIVEVAIIPVRMSVQ